MIVQFSYLGWWLGVETVFSHLLQQIAKIHGLKKITFSLNIFKWSASFIIIVLDKNVWLYYPSSYFIGPKNSLAIYPNPLTPRLLDTVFLHAALE